MAQEFLSSEVFSEMFFRNLMGIFSLNNLTVSIDLNSTTHNHIISTNIVSIDRNYSVNSMTSSNQLILSTFSTSMTTLNNDSTKYGSNELTNNHMNSHHNEKETFEMRENLTGTGLYSKYSKLNHSCVPNTTNVSRGVEVLVYACRNINCGEEITTSYLETNELLLSTRKRAKKLSKYLFICSCSLCSTEKITTEKVAENNNNNGKNGYNSSSEDY
jgi:hypothetical protein